MIPLNDRLAVEQVAGALALLRRESRLTPLTHNVQGVATHPEDDLVLATALSGQAEYFVTGDAQLQRLGAYHSLRILSPRAFVEYLESL